jgi:hypothetical protein
MSFNVLIRLLFSVEGEADGPAANDRVGGAGHHAVAQDESGLARAEAEVGAGQDARLPQGPIL